MEPLPQAQSPLLRERFAEVGGGVRLHVVESGDGFPVLLLHGFPEHWYSWRHQIAALAPRFRVIAPDQRGYNTSDKPGDYRLDAIVDDAAALIAQAGGRAHVVGHDWGAPVAWQLALRHPDAVARLAILNGPHPVAMARALRSSHRQRLRSWYMAVFQIPRLPEWLLTRDGARALGRLRGDFAHPERLTDEDLARYREAFLQPGAARAAIDWYRAARRGGRSSLAAWRGNRVRSPTLIFWGTRDRYLGAEAIENVGEWMDGPLTITRLEAAGHFVQQDCPDEVNAALLEFFGEAKG
ncbi:MAG: alpha/beta hydrolase [Myxococcota bacterium]